MPGHASPNPARPCPFLLPSPCVSAAYRAASGWFVSALDSQLPALWGN